MHQEVEAMAHGLDVAVGGDVHLHAGNGKGRHLIRASFQAVGPKYRRALPPPEQRITAILHAVSPLDSPSMGRGSGRSGRLSGALVNNLLAASGAAAGCLVASSIWGGRCPPGSGRGKADKGPEGDRGLCRGRTKSLRQRGGTFSRVPHRRLYSRRLIFCPGDLFSGGRDAEVLRSIVGTHTLFSYVAGILLAAAAAAESGIDGTRTPRCD
jgi:hypothetical protein